MLEPFAAIHEAGFSKPGNPGALWEGWTPDLIASLDWMRLAELARAMAAHAGCKLAGSRVFPDGSVMFAMFERPNSASQRRALVKITAWNEWSAAPHTVEAFAREIRTAKDARGILIAPAGFTPAALHAAGEHQIEPVDGGRLAATLRTLPQDKSDFFYVICTGGDCMTPTCPSCMKKLSRREQDCGDTEAADPNTEYVFQSSAVVAEPVVGRRIEVMANCEVQFLGEVRAREMVIHGQVSGDLVCDGTVTLEKGATLSGTVAARAVKVRDGAELLSKTRVLEGEPQPVVAPMRNWFWVCENPLGNPLCKRVAFEPHG